MCSGVDAGGQDVQAAAHWGSRGWMGMDAPIDTPGGKTRLDSSHTSHTQIIPGGLKPRCEKQNLKLFSRKQSISMTLV